MLGNKEVHSVRFFPPARPGFWLSDPRDVFHIVLLNCFCRSEKYKKQKRPRELMGIVCKTRDCCNNIYWVVILVAARAPTETLTNIQET